MIFETEIQPNELAKHGFPRPKRVSLIEGNDSEGEEAFHIYLVFPDDTRDEDLAWNKIEPMVSWVRNFVWEKSRTDALAIRARQARKGDSRRALMARISHDLLAQARILATREPRRPKQATLRRSVSTCYYALFTF